MPIIRTAIVVGAALALAIPTWAGLQCGRPDWFYVCPALVFLPLALIPQWWELPVGFLALQGPLVFLVWSNQLLRGHAEIPRRSRIGLGVLSVLTVGHFAFEWHCVDFDFWGPVYFWPRFAMNAGSLFLLWVLLRLHRVAAFPLSVAFHWACVAWLQWCAFPGFPPFCSSGKL